MQSVEFTIEGSVHGVGFRYRSKELAERLGITGWIQNAENGTVTGVISGKVEDVTVFIDWCSVGPAGARVDRVTKKVIPEAFFDHFEIRF